MSFSKYLEFPSLKSKIEPKYEPINEEGLSSRPADDTYDRSCAPSHRTNWRATSLACVTTAAVTALVTVLWLQLNRHIYHGVEDKLYNPVFGQIPIKPVLFEEDMRFINSDPHDGKWDYERTEPLTAWDELYSGAWIVISNPSKYSLSGGVPVSRFSSSTLPTDSEAYVVSMLHQIHCVGELKHVLMDFAKGKNTTIPEHTTHCIEYLRQAVLCNGDLTLERPAYVGEETFKGSSGWGATHQCRDWSILKTFPRPTWGS